MRYAIVDDEEDAIETLQTVLHKICAENAVYSFFCGEDFLAWLANNTVDVAFLDVELPDINGLELTKRLRELCPQIHVLLVTGFSSYALVAHALYVSAFLLKPVTTEKVLEALEHLRPVAPVKQPHIRVQAFGNFDVFVDGQLLTFPRAKSKELLAYLVHRAGSSTTTAELTALLLEDKPYNRSTRNQMQKIISVMMRTLRDAGAAEMVDKHHNSLRVEPTTFDCDYYNFLNLDTNIFHKEYMQCYSWAEERVAKIFSREF